MSSDTGLCIGCMSPMEGDGLCPLCGYDNTQPNARYYLQPGAVITGRYAVGALKSSNSEGATYIGYDGEKDRPVWIREYFPHAICDRDERTGLITPQPGFGAQYKSIMSELVDLYNAVKRLSVSDSVIPIEGVVSANNTLYAIYRKLDAVTLEDYLAARGGKLPLGDAVRMFQPLCDTMSNMHARGDLHRGISPQTVYLDREGRPYLWGFCQAATRTGGSELEAELFNGYAAPEQYASNGWQGPWTDVYAMAALFYRTVSGVVPPKSTLVGSQRIVAPLKELVDDMPPSISDAVSDAMGIAAGDRTQTMASFASHLVLPDSMEDTAVTAVYDVNALPRAQAEPEPEAGGNLQSKDSESGVSAKYVLLALLCTALLLGGFLWYITTNFLPDMVGGNSSRPSSSESALPSSQEESQEPSSQESSQEEEDKTVPSLVGRMAEDVIGDEALAARFQFEVKEEYNDNYDEGQIFDQSPVEGTPMVNRGTVILTVSKGKRIITMPDLAGKTLDEAMEEMAKLEEEFETSLPMTSMERYDASTEPGKISSSMPRAGEEFDPRTTSIYVYISLEQSVNETRQEASSSSSSSRGSSSRESKSSSDAGYNYDPPGS